tara:strand:- start:232 stop:369 length:138 start_codon:yes stop_codon:yes gene_type:complete
MEIEDIKLPKQLMDNVRVVIENTKLFTDEEDFVTQAVVKQIAKYK